MVSDLPSELHRVTGSRFSSPLSQGIRGLTRAFLSPDFCCKITNNKHAKQAFFEFVFKKFEMLKF